MHLYSNGPTTAVSQLMRLVAADTVAGKTSASRGTAQAADEGLPGHWFGPDGHARVRTG